MSDKLIVEAIRPDGEPITVEYPTQYFFQEGDNGNLKIIKGIESPKFVAVFAPGRWCQARYEDERIDIVGSVRG